MRTNRYILIIISILATNLLFGQDNRIAHFYGLSINGGYLRASDTIHNNGREIQTNFIYEYHFKHFILQTGAGIGYANLNSPHFQTQGTTENQIDELGYNYTLIYSSSKSATYKYGYVQIPFLMGAQYNRFYFLVGAKVGYNFYGKTQTIENISESAKYDRYVSPLPLENRPKITKSIETPFVLDTRLSAEIGIQLSKINYISSFRSNYSKPICRMGVYFDYGYIPIGNIFATPAFDLAVGIRLTLLLQPTKFGGCKCSK